MKDIPVFSTAGVILGYLDSAAIPARALHGKEPFQLATTYEITHFAIVEGPGGDPALAPGLACRLVAFNWQTKVSVRKPDDKYPARGRHAAFVLEVALRDVELLGRVNDFKWFAERHGDIVVAETGQVRR